MRTACICPPAVNTLHPISRRLPIRRHLHKWLLSLERLITRYQSARCLYGTYRLDDSLVASPAIPLSFNQPPRMYYAAFPCSNTRSSSRKFLFCLRKPLWNRGNHPAPCALPMPAMRSSTRHPREYPPPQLHDTARTLPSLCYAHSNILSCH